MITMAVGDAERREVQELFNANFNDIDPDAVPSVQHDDLFAPLIARYIDDASGRLLGAALTCRAQVAAGAIMHARAGLPSGGYAELRDKHSELDLMCVTDDYRCRGVGGELVRFLEYHLKERGVRVWFGNVTEDLDVVRLRKFYSSHGFTVLDDHQPLPPLLGRNWITPAVQQPVFYFYKRLKPAAGDT